jgi:hypothetical protein
MKEINSLQRKKKNDTKEDLETFLGNKFFLRKSANKHCENLRTTPQTTPSTILQFSR